MTFYQGDTLNNVIIIDLDEGVKEYLAKEGFSILAKAIIQCGNIRKTVENPTFPIKISFTRVESKSLSAVNNCYIAVINDKDEKRTLDGSLVMRTHKEVVRDV